MDKRSKEYKAKGKRHESVLEEALKRFDLGTEAWSDLYECARADVRFVDADDGQWTDQQKAARKTRPCMTFDKVSQALDQVVGDHLQNKPGIKIRGSEDDDKETAEIYEGLIRQIESRGPKAYKTAFKFSVKGGIGAFEILHDYIGDDSMDQDIILGEIKDPFSAIYDPIIQVDDLRKMVWAIKFSDMAKDDFEAKYPDAATTGSTKFDTSGRSDWMNEDTVRIADYYRLVPDEYEIVQLSTGEVLRFDEFEPVEDEKLEQGVTIVNRRMVKGKKLEHYQITAAEVLEEIECMGSRVPIIPVFGKQSIVDGKLVARGLVRKAKDAQRLYNHERSTYVETVNQVPRQQIIATQAMMEGHEDKWRDMNTSGDPVLPFNVDSGQVPIRVGAMQVPTALITGMQMSAEDIKSGTGLHNASLGMRSNETSGKAINARKLEGDTATYEFTDELVDSMSYAAEIMVQWIPKVYDASRQIRILGEDDAEKVVKINDVQMDFDTGEEVTLNDLSRGKYDVKVTVGASYSTRRVETQEQLAQIMASNPEMGMLIYDLYLNSLDIVGADEAVKRIRIHLIKQGIVEPTDEEKEELQQKAAENQQQPDPMEGFIREFEQARMKLEIESGMAEVAETASKTEANHAKAKLDSHKAGKLRWDAATSSFGQVAA